MWSTTLTFANWSISGSKFLKHVLVFKSEHQFWGGSVTFFPSNDTKHGTQATEVALQGNAGSNEEKLSSPAAAANGGIVELSGRVTQVSPIRCGGKTRTHFAINIYLKK